MIGLETTLFIYNIGSMLLIILLYPVLATISFLDSLIRCKKRRSKYSQKLNRFVFWNQPIVTMQEAYSTLTMSCLINLNSMKWGNPLEYLSASLTIFFLIVVFVYPIFVLIFMLKNRKELSLEEIRVKFGQMYLGIRVDEDGSMAPLFEPFLFFTRRGILALIIIM
jgi:hypothetical protein